MLDMDCEDWIWIVKLACFIHIMNPTFVWMP